MKMGMITKTARLVVMVVAAAVMITEKSTYGDDLVQLGHILFAWSRSSLLRGFCPAINAQAFGRVGSNVNSGGGWDGVLVFEVIPSRGRRSRRWLRSQRGDGGETRVLEKMG